MIHTTKDQLWTDESGRQVPVKYIYKFDRLKEKNAATIVKKARKLHKDLSDFKAEIRKLCDDVYIAAMKEFGAKESEKGNLVWYNFDRSIKIEVSVNERIDFDDLTIKACKERFDQFIDNNISAKVDFAKELVSDAFSTTRGKLDAKKVLSLLRYEEKITDPIFQEAIALLKKAIRRPDSRTYFRVSERDENGKYQTVDLNFSSID